MSVNTSFPTNSTFSVYNCLEVNVIVYICVAFTITKVFLIFPLSVFVLYLGHQQWQQHCSFKMTSDSDFFSFQMAAMELISELGWGLLCCGFYTHIFYMTIVGINVFFIIFPGQIMFHVLTCVEHYLAVVHPITYRGLKQSAGVRIRNICTGISVLCVLIRPGPGEVGKDRERVAQSKQKAFYTIMSIMGVLWLLFVGILVCVWLGTLKEVMNLQPGDCNGSEWGKSKADIGDIGPS
ncbi:hypothetical protein Q8A73_012593 [Channa argus]|nr:hypothetical protein Q8A73_012593 [Channa argus]